MDAHQFDSLLKTLSTAPVARRGTLRAMLGAALGLALGQVILPDAAARKRKKKGGHKKKKQTPRGCTPDCSGRECGNDGCDGSCGDCPGGVSCQGGTCEGACAADCAGKNCGSDGCGGSCGDCGAGTRCSDTNNGGVCQCATALCNGVCCPNGQTCIGNQCWADSEEAAFVTLITTYRAANGLPALALQNQLGAAAELHSQDQATNTFSSHTGSDGSSPDVRIARAGYRYSWWAENIYRGGATANEAFTWWKNSSGHDANMRSTNVTQLGIGRARSSAGIWYWTTTFGKPA